MIVENDTDARAIWEHVKTSDDGILIVDGSLRAQKWLKKLDYDMDAAVIDLALDDGDGVSLTEIIRRQESIRSIEKGCMIFWFTGWPITQTLETMQKDLGVTAIFRKPMEPIGLINTVKGYLGAI